MSELGEKLIGTVREVVAERPDFVYEPGAGCVYVHNGQPSCLLGHALWRLGLITADLSPMTNGLGITAGIPGLESLDQSELNWLDLAQGEQDLGSDWAHALVVAERGYVDYEDERSDDDE